MSEREMSIRFESTLYDHDIFHEPQYLEIPLHENLPPVTEDLRNDYIESDRLQRRLYPDWSRLPFIYRRTVEYQRAPIGPAIVAEPFIESHGSDYDVGAVEFSLSGVRSKCLIMQLRWVKERNEWVAIAYRQDADNRYEWYYGPYSLDDYCLDRLRQGFDIPTWKTSSDEIVKTPPSELEKIGSQN